MAGDALSINIAGKSISQIKIEKPDSIRDFINPEDFSGSGFLSYNNTDRTGIFRIYSGTNILNEVAINHNPLESVAESMTEDEIEEYLSSVNFKGNHFYIKKGENPVEVIQQARYGSELWKIFILAAIITALLEMLVARNVKKELAEV